MFSKASVFNYLALLLLVLAGDRWIGSIPNRSERPDASVPVRFTPARFAPQGFAPLRLAGAWRVDIADPRFGGVSALAVDRGGLLALTDSGSIVRLPVPGQAGQALIQDLPAGPGSATFKRNRDSEALARDPGGRGWWVAFEQRHQLWLYDRDFRRGRMRIDLGGRSWRSNRGIEAMLVDQAGRLALFPESGREWLQLNGGEVISYPLASRFGSVSDAARAPDGRALLVTRKFGPAGLAKRLVVAGSGKERKLELHSLARLSLGATDNVEAIAVEPRPGGTRLWLMTDNDFRSRAPTYLVALDWP